MSHSLRISDERHYYWYKRSQTLVSQHWWRGFYFEFSPNQADDVLRMVAYVENQPGDAATCLAFIMNCVRSLYCINHLAAEISQLNSLLSLQVWMLIIVVVCVMQISESLDHAAVIDTLVFWAQRLLLLADELQEPVSDGFVKQVRPLGL